MATESATMFPRRKRRPTPLAFAVAMLLVATTGAMQIDTKPAAAAPPVEPLEFAERIPEPDWQADSGDYLQWVADQPLSPGNAMSIMGHAENARRTGGTWDSTAPSVEAFESTFTALEEFQDTNDFKINSLLQLYVNYGDELDQELQDAIVERILAFKYWYTEPTPEGIVDDQYYWTENHLLVFLADEMIAGEQFPDETFTNSGMTGAEHVEHARPLIQRWIALRARYGFSEWLSNVYWMEDFMGLILLADLAEDPEIAAQAAAMLDSLFVELSSHLHKGAFGATHGRSYNKDKMTALDEDTFTLAQMVFGDSGDGYQRTDRAVQLAVANRYRPPEVSRRIVADNRPSVMAQRQSLPIDPSAPITANPVAPDGLSYDDEFVWWSMGGQFPWQIVPRSMELIRDYDLLDTANFQQVADLRPIIENSTDEQLQSLALQLAPQLNAGLLSEARTTTYRDDEVMLSSVQGWRAGERSEQTHVWQATLDADAQVFTTHPAGPIPTGTTDWYKDTDYWTGSGSLPWTVQQDKVAISIYDPGYESNPDLLSYEPFTHAYFPTDYFDEVVQEDGWTFGRLGNAYVALWSLRPAEFVAHDPAVSPTNGMTGPFDLVAAGGPDDVWISEVGSAAENGTFQAFVDDITAAPVTATRQDTGYSVTYDSPSAGMLSTAWDQPITTGTGAEASTLSVGSDLKWSSPWSTVRWGDMCAAVEADGVRLDLDFSSLRPLLTDPNAAPAPGPCYVSPAEPPSPPTTPPDPTPPTNAPAPPDPVPSLPGSVAGKPVSDRPPTTGPAVAAALQPVFTG